MSKKLLFNNNIDNINNAPIPFTYKSWWLSVTSQGVLKGNYAESFSIIFPIEEGKQYKIFCEGEDEWLYAFLDENYNAIGYTYTFELKKIIGYIETEKAPKNSAYVLAYLSSSDIETNVKNIEVIESSSLPNIYNENDLSMQTYWWVDTGTGELRKEYYDVNYSIIVPIEENKRYYLAYTLGNRYYWAFTDINYNQINVSPPGWNSEGNGWVASYYYNIITEASPSNSAYLVVYTHSQGVHNVRNIVVREYNG